MQYNAFQAGGETASYKLRIRFLEDEGALWTVHRKTQDAEILDHEASFVRKNR